MLAHIVAALRRDGFLTDELTHSMNGAQTGKAHTWFGLCQLPRCECDSACPHPHLRDIAAPHLPLERRTPDLLRAHLHRRIDLKVYPREQYPFAVVYFTGSAYFNRSIRLYCQKKGLTLSDTSLRPTVRVSREKVHEGAPIPCATERDIFDAIGVPWREPEDRNI